MSHRTAYFMMDQKGKAKLGSVLTRAYHDYGKSLYAYTFFKVHDTATREDLVQDTFMKTWLYLVKGGKVEIMKAFLYHVLKGLIVDEYRKHKTASLDNLLEKGFQLNAGDHKRLINILDGKAAIILIQRLPEKYQKVMRMKYVQDLSLKEMALLSGQSENTIAVQLHRGLKKLKLLYESA